MLLRDLLADPELGLVLLAGEEYVDRPVRGVYITDLLDPRRYLEGGELVLSGLVWHTGPQTSEQFVAALADAGVAGLASGTARLGHAPPDLVDACKRHGVPVFEVPLALSFNVLAERVQRRGAAPRRELVSAAASGAGLERVLSMAAGEFGADCWVLSCAGWVVGGTAELTGELRRALVDDVLRSGRLPRAVRVGDHGFAVWPVESDTEPPPPAGSWPCAATARCGATRRRPSPATSAPSSRCCARGWTRPARSPAARSRRRWAGCSTAR
ncbi:PucR family transcriptional regulator ligand-binding domain-containing protein [Saccharopolyspora spinosporotrichia]